MGISHNVAGVWKTDATPKINVAGVWKTPDQISINVAGVWKDMLSSLSVSPRCDGRANNNSDSPAPVTCYVGFQFANTGTEYEKTYFNSNTNATTWLDAGSASSVWASWTKTTGSQSYFSSKSSGTRYNLGTTQTWSYSVTSMSGTISRTLTGYGQMFDAASGGNTLWTGGTYSWNASASVFGGGCPLCCFPPDTPILMSNGTYLPISKVRPGDKVASVEPTNFGELNDCIVDELIVRENVPMYKLSFSDGRTITTSPDHPFHTPDGPKSLALYDEYKTMTHVQQLKVGDSVATSDGKWVQLQGIKSVGKYPVVMTFSNQLFFANGLLVY